MAETRISIFDEDESDGQDPCVISRIAPAAPMGTSLGANLLDDVYDREGETGPPLVMFGDPPELVDLFKSASDCLGGDDAAKRFFAEPSFFLNGQPPSAIVRSCKHGIGTVQSMLRNLSYHDIAP